MHNLSVYLGFCGLEKSIWYKSGPESPVAEEMFRACQLRFCCWVTRLYWSPLVKDYQMPGLPASGGWSCHAIFVLKGLVWIVIILVDFGQS